MPNTASLTWWHTWIKPKLWAGPTLKDTPEDGLCVLSQQLCLGNGSQGQVTGHVPAQLLIAPLQEFHCHWHSQGHHWGPVVILQKHEKKNIIVSCWVE